MPAKKRKKYQGTLESGPTGGIWRDNLPVPSSKSTLKPEEIQKFMNELWVKLVRSK